MWPYLQQPLQASIFITDALSTQRELEAFVSGLMRT
jgi:hypothetical protein